MRFVGCRAIFSLELEGGEVGFVDFAEAEGVGGEAFTSFDFDEVFSVLPAVEEGEADGVVCYFIPFGKNGGVRKIYLSRGLFLNSNGVIPKNFFTLLQKNEKFEKPKCDAISLTE